LSRIETSLEQLGLELPRPMAPPPGFEYPFALVRILGNQAYISGHAPSDGPDYVVQGKVGDTLSVEEGYRAARLCALSMLSSLKAALGDLDRVASWVRAVGYVNCVPDFEQTFVVVNGFSDLVVELWGEAGRHARAAPGVAALPFGVPVVVEATVEITGAGGA
jgi:enamine deaminase RidA (YjgF/YER057c/UK114 family)